MRLSVQGMHSGQFGLDGADLQLQLGKDEVGWGGVRSYGFKVG